MSSSPESSPLAASSDEPAPSGSSSAKNTLLSYPTFDAEASTSSNKPSQSKSREVVPERLFIGNLHPAVTEHTLIQIFSKYGNMSQLDFLYHKTGALKGKPRGYAFIEYANSDDATTALASAHGKLLHGRKLVVTHANQAPMDATGSLPRRVVNEAGRPTTLSLIKSASAPRNRDAISALEAKLKQMERDDTTELVTPPLEHPLPAKPTLAAAVAALPHSSFPAPKASAVTLSLPASPHHKRSPSQPGSKPSTSAPGSKLSTPVNHKPTPTPTSSSTLFKHPPAKPKILAASVSVPTSSIPSKRPAPSLKGVKLVKKAKVSSSPHDAQMATPEP